MIIKIGNIVIEDWVYDGWDYCRPLVSPRYVQHGIVIYYHSVVYFSKIFPFKNEWERFYDQSKAFDSIEEAKSAVDNFLIKMSKLAAFI